MDIQSIKDRPIFYIKTEEMTPYAKNSRVHSEAQVNQIIASIEEFGFTNPIIVDEDNGIIAGHGRVMAAEKMGLEVVPCIMVKGWTDEQKAAYVIADNKLALNADWDMTMLSEEIFSLQDAGYNIGVIGFSDEEIEDMMPEIIPAVDADPDDVPEVGEAPVTILGDIWQLGKHRLICGDSTDGGAVALLMDGEQADLLVTDPPYNVAYEGKTKDALTIQNDEMSDTDFREFLRSCMQVAFDNMRAGASFYVWHADSEGYNFRGAIHDCGQIVRQCLIWVKQSMVMGRQDYHWIHEPCLYGWKDGAAHLWASDRKQTTVLNFDRPSRNDVHPTMKPIDLIEYQIRNNTKKNNLVLDLFLGSGSTLIAAHQSGRRCYGVELDPKYCDVIIKRWEQFSGEKAVHENGKDYETLKAERI